MRFFLLFNTLLLSFISFSQDIRLLKDISPGFSEKAYITYPKAYADDRSMFFISETNEIYRTEGTRESTKKIRNSKIYYDNECIVKNGELYFAYIDIFKTSGDTAIRLTKFENGVSSPSTLLPAKDGILFIKSSYISDPDTLFLLKDDLTLLPLLTFSSCNYFQKIHNTCYLQINRNDKSELWMTDGTISGTRFLTEFEEEHRYNSIYKGLYFKGYAWFQIADQIWITDNSKSGTRKFKVSEDSNDYFYLGTSTADYVYFHSEQDSVKRFFRFSSAASKPDTVKYTTGYFNSFSYIQYISGQKDKIFSILRTDYLSYLYKINDKDNWPVLLKKFNHKLNTSAEINSAANDQIFFTEHSGKYTHSLWTTDDTEIGIKQINSWVSQKSESKKPLLHFKGSYYHITSDGKLNNLYKIDAQKNQTLICPFGKRIPLSSNPELLNNINGYQLFYADYALWKTKGDQENTNFIQYLNISNISRSVILNNIIYFTGYHERRGLELWRSDGTTNGTYPVKQFNTKEARHSSYADIVVFRDKLFIAVNTDEYNYTMFTSEGTAESTRLFPVKDYKPGSLTATTSTLFFKVFTGEYVGIWVHRNSGYWYPEGKWWKSDGTLEGTRKISEIYSDSCCFSTNSTIITNDRIYISLNINKISFETKNEIWDLGTVNENARKLSTLNESIHLSGVSGGDIIYGKNDGIYKITPNGLHVKISEIYIEYYWSIKSFDNKLIFIGSENNIYGLYVTDGTSEGTFLLNDEIQYFTFNFAKKELCNDILYLFSENKLWKTDGTREGTIYIGNLPGSTYKEYYYHMTDGERGGFFNSGIAENRIYFTLYTDTEGYELYTFSCKEESPDEDAEVFTLSPNPTTEILRIKLPEHYKNTSSVIYNTFGKKVWEGRLDNHNQVNVESLASGIYILEVEIEEVKNRFTFIKI